MKFWTVLPQATFLVANGNKIIACKFARFAANDVKATKVPLEMEPVVCSNNISWMLIDTVAYSFLTHTVHKYKLV